MKIFQKTILILKFKFPANYSILLSRPTIIGGKFKFQLQDSFLEYSFWRFEKEIKLSEKKNHLYNAACWIRDSPGALSEFYQQANIKYA